MTVDFSQVILYASGAFTAASLLATLFIGILPPADDSKEGISGKGYAVLHGIVYRLSVSKKTSNAG